MMNFWQDVRYGMRMLFKNPGFAAIAILTLALGIGANTALFSVVNGVLLNPLPFPEPDQLYAVYYTTQAFGHSSISYPNFLDWQKQNHSFSALGGFRSEDLNLTGSGEPERLHGHMISSEFFPATGTSSDYSAAIFAQKKTRSAQDQSPSSATACGNENLASRPKFWEKVFR